MKLLTHHLTPLLVHQVEEHFGACLGSVAAHAHIHAALTSLSFGSLSFMTNRPVTGMLRSAMATALSFTDHCPVMDHSKRSHPVAYQSTHSPLDFKWLLERCDGENQLALDVLRSFCEQGQRHLDSVQRSASDEDMQQLAFHAVYTLIVDGRDDFDSTKSSIAESPITRFKPTYPNDLSQNFLAGSASNIGAWPLEERCQVLFTAANIALVRDPACRIVLRLLVNQVYSVFTCSDVY
jgi:hypothetical protein